jgi:hypothetical protein
MLALVLWYAHVFKETGSRYPVRLSYQRSPDNIGLAPAIPLGVIPYKFSNVVQRTEGKPNAAENYCNIGLKRTHDLKLAQAIRRIVAINSSVKVFSIYEVHIEIRWIISKAQDKDKRVVVSIAIVLPEKYADVPSTSTSSFVELSYRTYDWHLP